MKRKTTCGVVIGLFAICCILTKCNTEKEGVVPTSLGETSMTNLTSCISAKETTSKITVNTSETTIETRSDLKEEESSVKVIDEPVTEPEQYTESIMIQPIEDIKVGTTTAVEPVKAVYKPSTHYFHNNNCRWVDDSCEDINWDNIGSYEGRICSECNPEVNGFIPYVVNTPSYSVDCTEYEIQLLAMLIHEESSGSWIGDNMVASTLINRCHNWGGGISDNIYKSGQFTTAYNLHTYDADEYEVARSNIINGAYDDNVMWFESAGNGLNNFYSGNTYNERCYYGLY